MNNDEFLSRYVFKELTEEVLAECEHFSCGVGDLDEYFQKDVSPFLTIVCVSQTCLTESRKSFVS